MVEWGVYGGNRLQATIERQFVADAESEVPQANWRSIGAWYDSRHLLVMDAVREIARRHQPGQAPIAVSVRNQGRRNGRVDWVIGGHIDLEIQ